MLNLKFLVLFTLFILTSCQKSEESKFEEAHLPGLLSFIAYDKEISTNSPEPVQGSLESELTGLGVRYELITEPEKGVLDLNPQTGQFTFTPSSGQVGTDVARFKATYNSATSNIASILITINPSLSSTITAYNLIPPVLTEDTESTVTLDYTDSANTMATSCTVFSPFNVVVTQACTCSGGICSVKVKGTTNYYGLASFSYTLATNGATSNSALATLTINPVADAPVTSSISTTLPENSASIITLSYTDAENDLATACTISSLSNVTVTQACACSSGICTVGVQGTTNYNGAASFSYTVTATGLTSGPAAASLTITAVADAPAASAISSTFNEDTATILTLSYSDAESDLATSCTISSLSNVTVTQACACSSGTCTVGVQGTTNYNGAASFNYTVTANGATSNTAAASLTITAVADAPVASGLSATFNEDTATIINLGYTDAENDQATLCTISSLSNVTVTQACACSSGTCTVGVQGTTSYNGAASFNYTVTANGATSNTAAASLTISAVADAPVAAAISATFNEDTATILTLSYSDEEGDQATACTTSSLSNVTVTQACACSSGTCTVGVQGTANYNGTASFNYTVTANGATSSAAAASLTISAVADAPVASAISSTFNEDTATILTLSYSDAESDLATSCTISSLSNVTVTQACACSSGTCTVGVQGTTSYNGAASFNYTVTANGATSSAAAASLTISAVADAPVASAISSTFNEDTATILTLSYSDEEGDQATACTTSSLSNVTVTQACACSSGTCTVGVQGTTSYNGTASFNYTVTANGATSNTAAASLTISAVADAPVAAAISATFNEDTATILTLSYSDEEGDQATACTTSSLSNVTVTQACACSSGTCTIGVQGTANYNGTASFNYTVTANGATSSAAAASLTISAVDDAPVAAALTPSAFNEDTEATINLSYSDSESHVATACTTSSLSNVTVTEACSCTLGACSVKVKGTAGYNGTASFNYTVTANSLTSSSVTASLTISAVADAPVAAAVSSTFNEDTAMVITLSYSDQDNDAATACTVSSLSNVTVTQACACTTGTCTVEVKGTSNFNGSGSFNYTVTANGDTSNSASASLTINAVDDAPVASAITATAFNEDTTSVITLSYSDYENNLATACTISSLSNAQVTQACACDSSGVCTVGVSGTSNYNGTASFNYTVTANGATSNTAAVGLSINAVADSPVAAAISPASFAEDTDSTITLSYTDADGDQASACTISSLNKVSVTTACACASGTCTVTVKGDYDYYGTASFNYTVTANGATSSAVAASLTITAVAETPATVSGLKLWLDPSDQTTLFASSSCAGAAPAVGGNNGCIADKSSTAAKFVNGSGTTRPTFQGDSLDFDKTLPAYLLSNVNYSNATRSFFVVLQPDLTSGLGNILLNTTAYTTAAFAAFMQLHVGSSFCLNLTGGTTCDQTIGANDTTKKSLVYAVNNASGTPSANSGLNGTLNTSIAGVSTITANKLILGAYISTTNGYDGRMYEILMYDVELSTYDRQKVEGILACKWNMQAQLPTGHPHKTTCPN